tara:strand:- start:1315 stop:1833 length:519 start_codon:yes stop_codon:yes gene_type:complete
MKVCAMLLANPTPQGQWMVNLEDMPDSLEAKQEILNGYIEYIPLGEQRRIPLPQFRLGILHEMICNEEGLMMGLPLNSIASQMANMSRGLDPFSFLTGEGLRIVGDVLIIYDMTDEPMPLDEINRWFGDGMDLEVDDSDGSSRVVLDDGTVVASDDTPSLGAMRSSEAQGDE